MNLLNEHLLKDKTMKTQTIDVEWTEGLQFTANIQDTTLRLASSTEELAGTVSPKRLLLVALAGCTAMDVASLLPKMRVPFTKINVSAEGKLTEEHPMYYHAIHMVYEIGVEEQYLPKVEMAIEKSITKYCGVHEMLKQAGMITFELKLV